jgi:hypothetical protein
MKIKPNNVQKKFQVKILMKTDAYCSMSLFILYERFIFQGSGGLYDSGRPSVNTPGKYDTHMLQIRKDHITPKKGQCHERLGLDLRFLRNWRQFWHCESSRVANISIKMMTIFYTQQMEY